MVRKPAGWNTHAPGPYANEGIYDWLRHRDPRWAPLAIVHRLDKETSGLLLFTKTPEANKSLTLQFTGREVRKTYLLLVDRRPPAGGFVVASNLARVGDRYASRREGQSAETRFEVVREIPPLPQGGGRPLWLLRAEPLTGRTHQIRVHASERGLPILGDSLYGGSPASRLFLHATSLGFRHPATGEALSFTADPGWGEEAPSCGSGGLGETPDFIDPAQTDAFRLLHGAASGTPGLYLDRLGPYLLSQGEEALSGSPSGEALVALVGRSMRGLPEISALYHKRLMRRVRGVAPGAVSPERIAGGVAPDTFVVRENGLCFELSFREGYSVGVFLDQRDNRRRWLVNHVAARFPAPRPPSGGGELLNTFAYTCGFSVAAAAGGWRTTSLDLSKKYLEWGRRNFRLNGIDPEAHDYVFGDTFDWLRRWGKRGRRFHAIVLDPPTFSESKEHGRFQAEKDYGRLVQAALGVLEPNGTLLASTNAAKLEPEAFIAEVTAAVAATGRRVVAQHYVPQPPDFPMTREEPGYLKTVWVRVT